MVDYRALKPSTDQIRDFSNLIEMERWDSLFAWYQTNVFWLPDEVLRSFVEEHKSEVYTRRQRIEKFLLQSNNRRYEENLAGSENGRQILTEKVIKDTADSLNLSKKKIDKIQYKSQQVVIEDDKTEAEESSEEDSKSVQAKSQKKKKEETIPGFE